MTYINYISLQIIFILIFGQLSQCKLNKIIVLLIYSISFIINLIPSLEVSYINSAAVFLNFFLYAIN
jgi:hypothetical protein